MTASIARPRCRSPAASSRIARTSKPRETRQIAKRFVDRCYLSGAWEPPTGVPQREWYVHDHHWPAARYQNLFQEMNANVMAVDNDLLDRDNVISELWGLDARKVDRQAAISRARRAALETGPAADIIRTEVEKDEVAVAEAFANTDDDAVGLRNPMVRSRRY